MAILSQKQSSQTKSTPPNPPSPTVSTSATSATSSTSSSAAKKRNSSGSNNNNNTSSNHQASNESGTSTTSNESDHESDSHIDCPLCALRVPKKSVSHLENCLHQVCMDCMQRYLKTEIDHSRLSITCPICPDALHPDYIKVLLQNERYYQKYERFMLRRVLAAEPDARWCPAPDCDYAVLAHNCASCPKIDCARDGCNTSFCYHCKQEWHPHMTCESASRRKRHQATPLNVIELIQETNKHSTSQITNSIGLGDVKECPVCASRIMKMNDGSCNHMTCNICGTQFCWLCMKEITDLHYFSPSGCTFWGKRPWGRKKKLLWRLGMLVGAPICIVLIAGIAVPAIVIGIPVWAARKIRSKLERKPFSKYRKNAILTGGVLLSFVVSPIISALTLAIGIPILLGYVYGVVPLSLCRSSGGCLSPAASIGDFSQQFRVFDNLLVNEGRDGASVGTASTSNKLGDPSIYMSNISLDTNGLPYVVKVDRDLETTSNAALAGSILSGYTAEAGSSSCPAVKKDSGTEQIPAEVYYLANSSTAHPSSAVLVGASVGAQTSRHSTPVSTKPSPQHHISETQVTEL